MWGKLSSADGHDEAPSAFSRWNESDRCGLEISFSIGANNKLRQTAKQVDVTTARCWKLGSNEAFLIIDPFVKWTNDLHDFQSCSF